MTSNYVYVKYPLVDLSLIKQVISSLIVYNIIITVSLDGRQ